ncbi:MAG: glycosyltransferase, partial [Firmicutes bacterium]|nr:glycosyltransferase [Bacillota bacterium]
MTLLASVVIPTYNQKDLLKICLRSLFAQTASPDIYELIVIDDGSTDGTDAVVAGLAKEAPCKFTCVKQENLGRSRTRNNGALRASGKYLIFLDGDMIVRASFVAAHLAAHTRPGLIVHGPVINTPKIADPSVGPKKVCDFSRAFFATGNVSIEREKFLAAGMFDEDFVEYGWEDLELGERLRKMGLKTAKSPEAYSYHYTPRFTCQSIPRMIAKEKERGHTAVLFYRKNPSLEVRIMTLITPIYFAYDRLLTLFHWPERPAALKLLKWLDRP